MIKFSSSGSSNLQIADGNVTMATVLSKLICVMECIIAYKYIKTMNKIASISNSSLHIGEFIIFCEFIGVN
jgi:hypothetical protein